MSDYTETFIKTTGDTVAAADFETEFDAIATMSATKANKKVPGTTNNVATLDASGDLADSTILYTDVVTLTDTQTLTNKVLTTPSVTDGVAFPATQNPSADANTLDDYEEGTFTPTLQDQSLSDSESQTYSVQTGFYTKIGNRVFFDLSIQMSSLGSLTAGDRAYIAGLPFTSDSTSNHFSSVSIYGDGLNVTAGYSLAGTIPAGSDAIALSLWDATGGCTIGLVSEISASGRMYVTGSYQV